VTRGQLIAFSGQTGIGVPHLHWEIRDRTGAPVSQRSLGLAWPDTSRPVFRKLLVIPVTLETAINGDYFPVVVTARRQASGSYAVAPIRVNGQVAFGIDVYDPANGGGSKLGVHSVETSVDGMPVFRMEHERIGYSHSDDGTVAYHPFYRSQGKFLMQWKWPGMKTQMYREADGDGAVHVASGRRSAVIQVEDFYNNQSKLSIPLVYEEAGSVAAPAAGDTGTGRVLMDAVGEWLVLTVVFTGAETETPILLDSGEVSEGVTFNRISDRVFRARYVPIDDANEVGLSIEHPRAGRDGETGALIEHRFWIAKPGSRATLGGVQFHGRDSESYGRVMVTAGVASAGSARDLVPLGSGFEIWPAQAPFKQGIEITLPWPANHAPDNSGYGVYQKFGEKWSWVDSEATDSGLRFRTTHLGRFQIMQDITAPSLRFRWPPGNQRLKDNIPAIELAVLDRGSGIAGWSAKYNGEWLLVAYDPEQNLLYWERDRPLPSGTGELTVTAWDEAGNRETVTRTIVVP
jgi:hypothetical protein